MAEEENEGPQPPRSIFLEDAVEVDGPLSDVWPRFGSDGCWLAPLATSATENGETLLRVGPGGGLSREVSIKLGTLSDRFGVRHVPIRWEATRLSRLFPILDGDLELTAVDGERCRLGMKASYRPPLDGLGRWVDAALLHRVAEATVRSFLVQLAECLQSESSHEPGEGAVADPSTPS